MQTECQICSQRSSTFSLSGALATLVMKVERAVLSSQRPPHTDLHDQYARLLNALAALETFALHVARSAFSFEADDAEKTVAQAVASSLSGPALRAAERQEAIEYIRAKNDGDGGGDLEKSAEQQQGQIDQRHVMSGRSRRNAMPSSPSLERGTLMALAERCVNVHHGSMPMRTRPPKGAVGRDRYPA